MEDKINYHGGGGYGNKHSYHRTGPTSRPQNKVCIFWQSCRCNRDPCLFLHELPSNKTQTQIRDPSNSKRPHRQNLVWINPAIGANANLSKWGLGHHRDNTNANTGRLKLNGEGVGTSAGSDRLCKFFLSDNCTFVDRCRHLHSWSIGDGFSLVTPLKGHEKIEKDNAEEGTPKVVVKRSTFYPPPKRRTVSVVRRLPPGCGRSPDFTMGIQIDE